MYQSIIFDNTDGVARITLNRPQVHHALNPEILVELLDAIKAAEADETVRVIVLSASGDKAFCSGADLKAATGTGKSVGELLKTY
ncbi:enoyl-CoA hydratase-related protein, partial [Dyadobacter sp. CY312]|uniref:enoyl-CoA hydratase-related protein n=1 Tax=Dyadobacter sp. CY312 TaxID=2907303 RepID=UPI001F40D591